MKKILRILLAVGAVLVVAIILLYGFLLITR